MTTTPQEPLKDEDIETTTPGHGPADAADADGADGQDAPGGDGDASDGGDADGTDA